MSSSSNPRLFFKIALVLVGAFATGGCFQPMFGGSSGSSLVDQFQAIRVQPINGRIGHYLEGELSFILSGDESKSAKKYKLVVSLSQKVQAPVIDTVSGRATAASVLIDAQYQLLEYGNDYPVATGSVLAATSYERSSQRFANLRAARDAEIKSARVLAEQIRLRLAADLARRI